MWPAMVIALLMGMLIGYFYARVVLLRPSPLLEEFDKLTEENERLMHREKHLLQEVADLRRRLAEEEKARAYYKKKSEQE